MMIQYFYIMLYVLKQNLLAAKKVLPSTWKLVVSFGDYSLFRLGEIVAVGMIDSIIVRLLILKKMLSVLL
jgi:hypothetical protein